MAKNQFHIVILGAGSVGCYLGGCLSAAGVAVTLIGRPRIQQEIMQHGLTLTDWQGRNSHVPHGEIEFSVTPDALVKADYILVTVKGGDTESAARDIAQHARLDATVASFQNGVRNAELLRKHLQNHCVLTGMVPFNVISAGQGRFHCGTQGDLALQALNNQEKPLVQALGRAKLPTAVYADMTAVQWGKLIMNLNNSINALAGLPLKEELNIRAYRKVFAASIAEALRVLTAAGIQPARTGLFIPRLMPYILTLPDFVFRRVAGAMLKIDPLARSSMAEDLELRRKTEIDYLNTEIVRLAEQLDLPAPINRKIEMLVRKAESRGEGSPRISGPRLLALVIG